MSEKHGQAGRYRDDLEARPVPKTCAYKHMIPIWGPCRGELQAEHSVELADNPWQKGDTAFLLWSCAKHNRDKADEARRQRQARKEGRVAETTPRSTRGATGNGRPKGVGATVVVQADQSGGMSLTTRLALAGLLVASALVMFFDLTDNIVEWVSAWWWVALILALAAGAGVVWLKLRARGRKARTDERALGLEAFCTTIARALGAAPGAVTITPRGKRPWDGNVLTSARIRYPGGILHDDPRVIEAVNGALRSAIGPAVRITTWERFGHFIDYDRKGNAIGGGVELRASTEAEIEAPPPDEERVETERRLTNLQDALVEQLKDKTITVTIVDTVPGTTKPQTVRVFYGLKFADAKDTARQDLLAAVTAKTGVRWRPEWEPPYNIVLLVRRPAMPAFVPNPACDLILKGKPHRFPLGVGEDQNILTWDIYDAPHALVAGGTGMGKTVQLQALIWWANCWDWEVVIVDPKGTGLGGLRDLPGVVTAALADPEIMNFVLTENAQDMRERYAKVLNDKVPFTHFRRRLVVVDEYAELVGTMRAWWKGMGEKGEPSGVDALRSILRLGREANVLMVTGVHQASAKVFGDTEVRELYGLRVGLGPQGDEAARMLFGRVDVGRDIPQTAKGRATYALKLGEAEEMQTFWTPTLLPSGDVKPRRDEDKAAHPEDVEAIERLRALVAARHRHHADAREAERTRAAVEAMNAHQEAEPAAEATTEPVERPTLTLVTPRQRAPKDARPPVPVGFLRTCVNNKTPARILVDGEAFHVDDVEIDETAMDHVKLKLRDGRDEIQWISFPDNELFELAED